MEISSSSDDQQHRADPVEPDESNEVRHVSTEPTHDGGARRPRHSHVLRSPAASSRARSVRPPPPPRIVRHAPAVAAATATSERRRQRDRASHVSFGTAGRSTAGT